MSGFIILPESELAHPVVLPLSHPLVQECTIGSTVINTRSTVINTRSIVISISTEEYNTVDREIFVSCSFFFLHKKCSCVTKWQKLKTHARNFCAFNFCCLSNWRQIFYVENFPTYSTQVLAVVQFCLASYLGSRRTGKERGWYTLFTHVVNFPETMENQKLSCYIRTTVMS